MNDIPQVVLVGRVNVGKSTLFNRIAKRVKALALDYEGVTRDFVRDSAQWRGVPFMIVDTGGMDVGTEQDTISTHVRGRALQLIEQSEVIVWVTDAALGITPYEIELAKQLHKLGKPVLIAANKIDVARAQEHLHEMKQLGFEHVLPISAAHNKNIDELLDAVVALLPRHKQLVVEQVQPCRVTLLGRPNVGKSSLMNQLLQQDRSIVTAIAGTTREAITERLQFNAQTIELTDTAGVRRQRGIKEGDLEEMMVKSSMRAVRESDIVVLLAEAQEGRLTDQELKLAFYAFEQGKALIIAINKDDLLDPSLVQLWKDHKLEYDFFYKKIVMINISCTEHKNIGKVLPLIQAVWHRFCSSFTTHELTHTLKQALLYRPLYRQEQRINVIRAEQIKTAPPTIKLTVNIVKFIEERELSFFESALRKEYQLKSVPIVFSVAKEE